MQGRRGKFSREEHEGEKERFGRNFLGRESGQVSHGGLQRAEEGKAGRHDGIGLMGLIGRIGWGGEFLDGINMIKRIGGNYLGGEVR